ncbi:glycine--tRNA ligase subunit alpha [bacterium]|nr:glycine--tRNA ligase subunit alpha [bacterium]MBU1674181.1 glycine--tRNA ligase subunit alpha [bacterium]
MDYQSMIARLQQFWSDQGCVVVQPYNSEVGAGTFNPATFLRCLGPEPWRVAYVEPSRRPKDGRYGQNPNRVQQFLQYQVLLKPNPPDSQGLYLESLRAIGVEPREHDIRFVEDDWESPTLGAAGLGWEVWIDGMEISQFTYFQQVGGFRLKPVSVELTYGLLRLAMYIQGVEHVNDLSWGGGLTWGDVQGQFEREFSLFNFELADVEMYRRHFDEREAEALALIEAGVVHPGYDAVIKCSHIFNLLEARGAISVTQRTGYITRVRNLARRVAGAYLAKREEMGYPLLRRGEDAR